MPYNDPDDYTAPSKVALLKVATGHHGAAVMLDRMIYWCSRKTGGVDYQGRRWSWRSQKEWIEGAAMSERTGKRRFAGLVASGLILAEIRKGGYKGYRRMMMHVALGDPLLEIMKECHIGTFNDIALEALMRLHDWQASDEGQALLSSHAAILASASV